ncbi:MAG: hypothetical protein LUQ65_08690, partial [Candidatus Helarchaeota archaeon]|nr:hypothetical protein [Candidatus Helarchaeota archaeon]
DSRVAEVRKGILLIMELYVARLQGTVVPFPTFNWIIKMAKIISLCPVNKREQKYYFPLNLGIAFIVVTIFWKKVFVKYLEFITI